MASRLTPRKRQQPVDTMGLVVTAPEAVEETKMVETAEIPAVDTVAEVPAEPVVEQPQTTEPEVPVVEAAQVAAKVIEEVIADVVPTVTVADNLIAVGKLYTVAEQAGLGIAKLLRTTADEPELHAFLSRLAMILGEFRHAVDQAESGLSDRMRDAIDESVG